MKLIAKARPVRIRIVSGGMEHSSLESLRKNFVISDLKEPLKDGRLVTWLKSIGELGIAEEVQKFDGGLNTEDDYRNFCYLFRVDDFESVYCGDFDRLYSDYKNTEDKDHQKWLKKFDRCYESNIGNVTICEKILILKVKILKEKGDFEESLKILDTVKDNSKTENLRKEIVVKIPKLEFTVKTEHVNYNAVHFNMIFVDGDTNLKSYRIGEIPVTVKLWRAVMGTEKSKNLNDPVTCTWKECKAFIDKLNELTNNKFVLPSEAQWEFVARGGNKSKEYKYSGSNNIKEVGWNDGKIHPVKGLNPNELGIYDMSGNVWEWCNSIGKKGKNYRIAKGGNTYMDVRYCEVKSKEEFEIDKVYNTVGFRLCLNI